MPGAKEPGHWGTKRLVDQGVGGPWGWGTRGLGDKGWEVQDNAVEQWKVWKVATRVCVAVCCASCCGGESPSAFRALIALNLRFTRVTMRSRRAKKKTTLS